MKRMPTAIDDFAFDGFYRDGVLVDVERAGGFARGRTDPAGELGEVVRGVKVLERRLPVVAVNQVVPGRALVVDRAARRAWRHGAGPRAERNAAVHASRRLRPDFGVIHSLQELGVVFLAGFGFFVAALFFLVLEEACRFAHLRCP